MNCIILTEIKDQTVLVVINKLFKQKGKACLEEVFTILEVSISSLSYCMLPNVHSIICLKQYSGQIHLCIWHTSISLWQNTPWPKETLSVLV